MKKTIAKMMAAAMLLSTVPAISLPTLTANAASPTVVTISQAEGTNDIREFTARDVDDEEDKELIGSVVSFDEEGDVGAEWFNVDQGKVADAFKSFDVTGDAKDFISSVTVFDWPLYGCLKFTTTGDASKLASLVKSGKNTFTVTATIASGVKAVDWDGNSLSSPVTIGTYRIGGTAKTVDGKTEVDVDDWSAGEAVDSMLKTSDGKSYIKIFVDGSGEITIEKNPDLDFADNDSLRGETLPLNELDVFGFPYPVTKFGSQALKGAHMKKLEAENVKKVGKGAFRKCKQVKKIDISDSNKVRKIHSKAFYGDKNLKTIAIDGRKLNTVGSGAFSGVKKNCNIKIKAKKTKFNSDVKLIKKSGAKNVKFTRVAP